MSENIPHLVGLSRWIAGLSYDDIPADALRAARYQVLNMFAAAYAAAALDEAAAVAKAARAFSGTGGRSTVIATGERLPPGAAASVNAAYAMAQDFDDIIWMGHTCHSAVFAALAVAEHESATARDFITAVVVANEVSGRLGASSFLGPLNGQMTTYIHLIGAAAATAKLLKLDADRTSHAMAIALSQPNLALQSAFMVPTSKLLSASTPTQTGIEAAYHAREGMTGDPGILEDKRGFWHKFAFVPLPYMLGDLGEFWAVQTLTMKTYPGCHFFQTACTAVERIMKRQPGKNAASVKRVKIETTKLAREATRFGKEYGGRGDEITHVNVNFDMATTIALLLHAGRLTGKEVDPLFLSRNSGPIRELRERVEIVHEPRLTAKVLSSARALPTGRKALAALTAGNILLLRKRYAAEYRSELLTARELAKWLRLAVGKIGRRVEEECPANAGSSIPLYFPSRVTIEFRDGTVEAEQVDLPVAAFCASGAEEALREKFEREGTPVLGKSKAREAFAAGLRLETLTLGDFLGLTTP